jgi:hypothetical protein
MKAMTCSQCGALIERIRIDDKFAECVYCHALIPVVREKVVEIPDKKPAAVKKPTAYEEYLRRKEQYASEPAEPEGNPLIGGIVILAVIGAFVVLIAVVFLNSLFTPPKNNAFDRSETDGETSRPAVTYPEPDATVTPAPTPIPDISYRSYVKYTTSIGVEHIELPTIEAEQLSTFDIKELKKTVFKEKRIRVRITINTDGEVLDAKALNGHEALRESSVRAARKSLFTTRKRESQTTLTYIYVLEE